MYIKKSPIEQYINQKFNHLTILSIDRKRMNAEREIKGKSNTYVFAQCDCNNNIKSYNLNKIKRNETKTCGCLKLKHDNSTKHNKFELFDNYGIMYTNNNMYFFDKEDYEKIKDKWWYEDSNGYAIHAYATNRKTHYISLHRFLVNANSEVFIDHINKERNDCRKNNLRICTHQQNDFNNTIYKNNTSGFIGVTFDKSRNKWIASITYNYKNIYLGRFENKDDAIKSRLKAEEKYFGEFAPQIIRRN